VIVFFFAALFSFSIVAASFLEMRSVPPAAEAWLAEIILSDQSLWSLYRRVPYRHHKDHITELEAIFGALSGTVPFSGLSKPSRAVHISDSTWSHWKKLLKVDPPWRPSRRAHAAVRRIFTDLQEKALLRRIEPTYLDRGRYEYDENFRHYAMSFYKEIRQQLENDAKANPEAQRQLEVLPLFKASAPFIWDFRRRSRLSLQRQSLKRRCVATPESQETLMSHVKNYARRSSRKNLDINETNWRSASPGFWTWATA
jgi:hypothetical protein